MRPIRSSLFSRILFSFIVTLLISSTAKAADAIYINEIQVSTSSTDWEFIELQGPPSADLSDLTLIGIESDVGSSAGTIDRAISLDGQSIPADGFWLAISPAGVTAYGVGGDMSISDNTFENSTATYLLVSGFSGAQGDDLDTDNDGVLDAAPWDVVLDSINLRDSESDFDYGAPSVGPDGSFLPSGTYRCPDAPQGIFDGNIHTFGTPDGTPGVNNLAACGLSEVYINEIQVSTTSTDWEFIELQGPPLADLSGLTLIGIESDSDSSAGRVDVAISLDGQSIPEDGFWVGMSPAGNAAYGIAGDMAIANNSFENSTATYLLVRGFTGAVGNDLDTDDDGTLDEFPFTEVLDGINLKDSESDFNYGATPVGPDGPFLPSGSYRCPDAPLGVFASNFHDFSTPDGTPGVSNLVACGIYEIYLNEIQVSTASTDWEFFELQGPPTADLSDLTLIGIESDVGSSTGTIDRVISLAGQSIPADGFWLGMSPAGEAAYGISGDMAIDNNSFENGTATYLLVSGFTGAQGDDLDSDDDGVLDSMPWSVVMDSLNLRDSLSDFDYGATSVGPDGSFLPSGTFRCPDAPIGTFGDNLLDFGTPDGTPGEANDCGGTPVEACGDAYTPIWEVQGSGAASPLSGDNLAIEGIVIGDFQDNAFADQGDLNGFFVQDDIGDGDVGTSDGVFVYGPDAPDVSLGDRVRVRGDVSEFSGSTQVTADDVLLCSPGNALPAAAELSLPLSEPDDFEAFEGMLVTFPGNLYIAEYFNFDRFGEIVLASGRLMQPTAVFEPGSPEYFDLATLNALSRVVLDDGRTAQNPDPAIHPNGLEFDLDNRFRGGDVVQGVTGVMDDRFGAYRVQPTQGAVYIEMNPRTAAPDDTSGNLAVASFNVLNYFNGDGQGGGFPTSRGADDEEEFVRQRDKIIAAITAIGPDVLGVIEIENDGYGEFSAIQDLVNGLNEAAGDTVFDFIDPGVPMIGSDEIAVGLIYRPASVTPQGASAILDSSVDPRFDDSKNRPALAQSFVSNATGGVFTVVVNHFKSKGSSCDDVGDPNLNDGSGNCNLTRAAAAEAMVDWLATDPTGSGNADFLVIGDLNAYDKEDPIDVFVDAGYTDLAALFNGEFAYSYLFSAQLGYLDYALASQSLLEKVTGATAWHINADEPDLIDYDTSFKQAAQDAIYAPDPYRSSDHDPVVVGLSPRFAFAGFFPPIRNLPAMNKAKAGSAIPVKFSLGGDYGLDIFAEGYPLSYALDCDSGETDNAIATETPGGSELQYDAYEDQYVYVWDTDKAWSGSCRQLVIEFYDGAAYRANFMFR